MRIDHYEKRRQHQIQELETDVDLLVNRADFADMVVNGELLIMNRKKGELLADLRELKFAEHTTKGGYDYLLRTSLEDMSEESIAKLKGEKVHKQKELDVLKKMNAVGMWKKELMGLREKLMKVNDFKV